MKEERREFVKWWILIAFLVLATAAIFVAANKDIQNLLTGGLRQAEQYQASKETMLLEKLQQWQRLDTEAKKYAKDPEYADVVEGLRNQQQVLLVQMRTEAGRLQENQVPKDVQEFLDEHQEQ